MGAFMKDKLLLLFWGILAGAAFVGCILVFGQGMNWINARGSFTVPPLYFKIGLLLVMVAVLFLLAKMWIFFNGKITRIKTRFLLFRCLQSDPKTAVFP